MKYLKYINESFEEYSEIIDMNSFYETGRIFDLKSKLEKKLYNKRVDIFYKVFKKHIKTSESDPYGEETWDEEPIVEYTGEEKLNYSNILVRAVLLRTSPLGLSIRSEKYVFDLYANFVVKVRNKN